MQEVRGQIVDGEVAYFQAALKLGGRISECRLVSAAPRAASRSCSRGEAPGRSGPPSLQGCTADDRHAGVGEVGSVCGVVRQQDGGADAQVEEHVGGDPMTAVARERAAAGRTLV